MNRSSCRYAPCYCEENVYYLSRRLAECSDAQDCACRVCADGKMGTHGALGAGCVVFISNPSRTCAMTFQRTGGGNVVVWDYHVVLSAITCGGHAVIYDLDSLLPFPVDAREYVSKSFPSAVPSVYRPVFRVVPGYLYARQFFSDRRHMRRADGSYLAPPPEWPPIRGEQGSNLEEFVDMSRTGFGRVVSRQRLCDVLEHCLREGQPGD